MRVSFHKIILCTLLIVLCGCNPGFEGAANKSKSANQKVTGDSSESVSSYSRTSVNETESGTESKPKIVIGKNEKFLEALNANLDLDETDEQILVLKDTTDPSSPLKLVVADHDETKSIYSKSWEVTTNATNPRLFKLELIDMVGDSGRSIVFHGMNGRNLTLDIYKRTPSISNPGLHFQPICQIISDGTIRIQKTDRSEAYELGSEQGESFAITVERKNINSQNDLDLIEETYNWVRSTGRYELISSKNIPADIASQSKLANLYSTSDDRTFLQFLKGPWFNKEQKDKLIAFYPDDNQIVLSFENIQEVYNWDYSKRTLYNGFMIIAYNLLIKSIKININITARAPNAIDVFIEDDAWSGAYQKLSEEMQEEYYGKKVNTIKPSAIELNEEYEEEFKDAKEGNRIIFEPPYFTWVYRDRISLGGYSIIENIPLTNSNYYKTVLQYLPKEVDNATFTNSIRKKITLSAEDQLLSKYYTFDRNKNSFFLNENTPRDEIERLWKLFVSVQYKGYSDYLFGVITFKFLKENGLVDRIDNYVLEYLERKDTDKTTRTIILTPGKLNVNGFEVITKDSIRLIQIDSRK
jgi:hypothetical protein